MLETYSVFSPSLGIKSAVAPPKLVKYVMFVLFRIRKLAVSCGNWFFSLRVLLFKFLRLFVD